MGDDVLLILGAAAALFGAMLLYRYLSSRDRWSSSRDRSWAIVSGVGWFAMGVLFVAAALAWEIYRTAALVAAAAAGVTATVCRLLIARQLSPSGEN